MNETLFNQYQFYSLKGGGPDNLSSRRAKRAGWPKGLKGPVGAFRRASAQAVTSKWQLRTTSPMNTNSSVGENWFLAKDGSWPGRL